MVPIRKTRAKASEDYGPDPALDLPGGAHLGIKSVKVFPPKFNEDTGDLWGSIVSMRLTVIVSQFLHSAGCCSRLPP
jgi:hypothetical protein